MLKALGAGVGLALIVVVAVVALAMSGLVPGVFGEAVPDGVIVIATAADTEGTEVAAFAYVLERDASNARPVDTTKDVAVAGTSARSPREAYPFVGAEGVSELLQAQLPKKSYGWIALTTKEWSAFIDAVGGTEIDVPEGVSVYEDGQLILIESGRQQLLGQEAGALAAAAEYGDESDSLLLRRQLSKAIASALLEGSAQLPQLVRLGRVRSSMTPDAIQDFFGGD